MKKTYSIILMMAIFVLYRVVFAQGESPRERTDQAPYKVGAIIFLTGGAAQYGAWVKNGLEIAKKEINDQGGINGHPLELVYEDDKSTPQVAVTAFNKLLATDKPPVVIAGLTSSSTLAIAPIAERNKTVLFSSCSSSPDITKSGDYIFRNWPSDNIEGILMTEYAFNTLRYRKIAILSINNDYGRGLTQVFSHRFGALGGQVISTEFFPENTTNFRTIIAKLKRKSFDAIYMPSHAREAGHFLRQMKENNLAYKVLGCVTFESPELPQIAGIGAEGVLFTTPSFNPKSSDETTAAFSREYREMFGNEPENFAAQSYDALRIIAMAISKVGYNADSIKDYLYTVKNYKGVSGLTSFDSNGDVIKPALIKKVINGEFVPIEMTK